MPQVPRLDGFLTGNDEMVICPCLCVGPTLIQDQDGPRIHGWLQELYESGRHRRELFQTMPYSISLRNARTTARYNKLMRFEAPDQDTLEMLTVNATQWFREPSTFWNRDTFPSRRCADPGARIVGLFLDVGGLDT